MQNNYRFGFFPDFDLLLISVVSTLTAMLQQKYTPSSGQLNRGPQSQMPMHLCLVLGTNTWDLSLNFHLPSSQQLPVQRPLHSHHKLACIFMYTNLTAQSLHITSHINTTYLIPYEHPQFQPRTASQTFFDNLSTQRRFFGKTGEKMKKNFPSKIVSTPDPFKHHHDHSFHQSSLNDQHSVKKNNSLKTFFSGAFRHSASPCNTLYSRQLQYHMFCYHNQYLSPSISVSFHSLCLLIFMITQQHIIVAMAIHTQYGYHSNTATPHQGDTLYHI